MRAATRPTSLLVMMLVTVGAVASEGCAHRGVPLGTTETGLEDQATTLRVRNDNWQDVRIYLVENGGPPVRVGSVSGLTSAVIRVRRRIVGTARLLIRPLGSRATALTNPVFVERGQVLELTVQTHLVHSNLVVW